MAIAERASDGLPLVAPRWVVPTYVVLAVALLPWIVWLAARHWGLAWVGIDVAELLVLALTAWHAHRRSTWVQASATAAATLLVVDAWFDVTTSAGGWSTGKAVLLALVTELPLAALSLYVAAQSNRRAGRPAAGTRIGFGPQRRRVSRGRATAPPVPLRVGRRRPRTPGRGGLPRR